MQATWLVPNLFPKGLPPLPAAGCIQHRGQHSLNVGSEQLEPFHIAAAVTEDGQRSTGCN